MKLLRTLGFALLCFAALLVVFEQPNTLVIGNANYWQSHGLFLLIGLSIAPRLSLLLAGLPMAHLVWWLGWLVTPRVLIAVLATLSYWQQNKILVVIAWLLAWKSGRFDRVLFSYIPRRAVPGPRAAKNERIIDVEVVEHRGSV